MCVVSTDFQRNQNHTAFSQAQQRFLQAQQSYNNSTIEWQQGLTKWANEIRNERNQQWWNSSNTPEASQEENDWTEQKVNQLNNKLGVTILNRQAMYELKSSNIRNAAIKADKIVQKVSVWTNVIDTIKNWVTSATCAIFKLWC